MALARKQDSAGCQGETGGRESAVVESGEAGVRKGLG